MTRVHAVMVRSLSQRHGQGVLVYGTLRFPCAIGRTGRRVRKREGDGATPIARMGIVRVIYRADHVMPRPATGLPLRRARAADGWCDAPADRNYNRPVPYPYPASAEQMWRSDALYDIVVVLDYNLRPRARNRGSAIFMHVARPGYRPTEGCIALDRRHLLRLLARLRPGAMLDVAA